MERTAGIVGAGIGGLAAGIALRHAGWSVTVFERAPKLEAPGAGLSIWPNGARALRALGLEALVEGAPRPRGALRKADGTVLAEFEPRAVEERFGAPLVGFHRVDLQSALLERLGPGIVRTDATVTGLHDGALELEHGNSESFDLIVGADGLRSVVRRELLDDGDPVDSGIAAFRGVAPSPSGELPAGEWWGPGCVAGLLEMSGGRTYWYVAFRGDPDDRAGLARNLEQFAPRLRAIAEATDPADVLAHRLYDRDPARAWGRGGVTLLGDAAHPMLPFLGQGACSALEDAAVLGEAAEDSDPAGIVRAYEARRIAPAAKLVKGSRTAARAALAGSAVGRGLRNVLIRTVPASARLRQLDGYLKGD